MLSERVFYVRCNFKKNFTGIVVKKRRSQDRLQKLLSFFVHRVPLIAWAIFFKLEALGGVHFVLLRDIVLRFALGAGKEYMLTLRFRFSHFSP